MWEVGSRSLKGEKRGTEYIMGSPQEGEGKGMGAWGREGLQLDGLASLPSLLVKDNIMCSCGDVWKVCTC